MIKKASLLALLIYLILVLLSSGLVQAQDRLEVLDNSVQVEFPYRINFILSAESDTNITDIRLHYTIERTSFAHVITEAYIKLVPDTKINAEYTLDMIKIGGLPPGSRLDYWWTVEKANGSQVNTTPLQVHFDDNRYYWHSLTEGDITIYWYEGKQSFAQELMATAHQALARLRKDTGAYPEKPIRVYVYALSQDLQGSMIYPQEWTGGVAFTRYDTLAAGISPGNLDWGREAIAHELTHLVIHQITFNPYSDLPVWLDEGLAMRTQGPLGPPYTNYINKAITEDSLISVRSLASPFSARTEQSYLSYAQSYSLVEFLISQYGQSKMLELLTTFKQGSNYDDALEKVCGFNMDGLDALWREYINASAQPVTSLSRVSYVAI
ncbi:peptidase MA family metallohydrolase [Chloroflexota bacterium]